MLTNQPLKSPKKSEITSKNNPQQTLKGRTLPLSAPTLAEDQPPLTLSRTVATIQRRDDRSNQPVGEPVREWVRLQRATNQPPVNARAYPVGHHVVMRQEEYAPATEVGRRLLAHELVYVVQQRQANLPPDTLIVGEVADSAEIEAHKAAKQILLHRSTPVLSTNARGLILRRFEASEKSDIAKFDDVLKTARDIAQVSSIYRRIDWGDFVKNAGGLNASDALKKKVESKVEVKPLPNRYVMTCRCGLVDMRHFYELMYLARFYRDAPFFTAPEGANRVATEKGREHELKAEATSRFAPEDTPSNALGAYLGSQVEGSGSITAAEFVNQLQSYLRPCLPVDFASLPMAEQDKVVDYYGGRDVAGVPKNQNETATPAAIGLAVCSGKSQSFPFEISASDPNKKTVTGLKTPYRLTEDSSIRDWVGKTGCADIDDAPDWEKIRLINRLLDGWVSDDDISAIEKICSCVKLASEMVAIDGAISPRLNSLWNKGQKERMSLAIKRRP